MSNWKPILTEILQDSGKFTARIVWVNEVEGKKVPYDLSLEGIKDLQQFNSILRTVNDKLDTNIELVKILSSQVGTELDITAEIIPTQKSTDLQLFLISYQKLQSIKRKVDIGLIDISDFRFTDQLKECQTLLINDSFLLIG